MPFNHLIDYKLDVLGIDLKKLSSSQHHYGCVVQDHADLDTGLIPIMPVDMARFSITDAKPRNESSLRVTVSILSLTAVS
jgi:hypothetical protein